MSLKVEKTTFEIDGTWQKSKERSKEEATASESSTSWIIPLCVSHSAAAWGERSWEFGAGLLLLKLGSTFSEQQQTSLRLTAILVLAESATCALCGAPIGRAVDKASFLWSAVVTLAIQSVGIAAAAGFLVWAFRIDGGNDAKMLCLGIGAIACSVVARLASMGSTISVERRWTTALSHHTQHLYGPLDSKEEGEECAESDDESKLVVEEQSIDEADHGVGMRHVDSQVLSRVNARLRCIDLTCNLCAPIAVGFLLENTSPAAAATIIAACNVLAWPVEVACLVWIHQRHHNVLSSTSNQELSDTQENVEGDHEDYDDDSGTLCVAWTLYYKQSIFRSALALAVLYLTVVNFGTIMTAWFAASGFHAGHLGAAKALAALTGMLSTVTTPRLVQNFGVEHSALWYIWFMWACIVPCTVTAFFVSTKTTVLLWIIVVAVVVSRFGLWGFDLCVTQLLQERIEPPESIGVVNGMQVALQNVFFALAAFACVLLPSPDTFVFLVLGSFGAVSVATLLHTSLWKKSRSGRPASMF